MNFMIRSMTGYGRGEFTADNRKFTVEIKTVNHRYNDITIKLPRALNGLEDAIRKEVMQKISRGKTDVYISFESYSANDVCVTINHALANAYVEKLKELEDRYQLSSTDSLSLVAKFPDVITVEKEKQEDDVIWNALLPALKEALEKLIAMRSAEGNVLANNILEKTKLIEELTAKIKERSPAVVLEYHEKLKKRLKELLDGVTVDEQCLATEIAILADKACIDEEITRLESHILQLKDILHNGGMVGRKLDFLIQEMNREANTIASKSNDLIVTKLGIELKSEIEKIREQVQNME